jgi:integrase
MARPPKPWYWAARKGWFTTIDGNRRRLTEGPKAGTKAAADREFHLLMVARGKLTPEATRLKVRDVFNLYIAHVTRQAERGERTEGGARGYTKHLISAGKALGEVRVSEVTHAQFLAWADKGTWGPSTRHQALGVIKAAFGWAASVRHIAASPLAGMKVPAMLRREAVPTWPQVRLMVEKARGTPFRTFLQALIQTGCRPSEISTLTADRVDLDAGRWRVVNKTRRKTGKDFRDVHLNEAMIALSRQLVAEHPAGFVFRNSRGKPWNKQSLAQRFIRLQRRCGFGPECSAYAFRHLYGTDGMERGVPLPTLAELMGHTNPQMVATNYNHISQRDDHLREAARQIRPPDEPPPPGPPR